MLHIERDAVGKNKLIARQGVNFFLFAVGQLDFMVLRFKERYYAEPGEN